MNKNSVIYVQYSSSTETIVDVNDLHLSTDYHGLLKRIENLKMDKFVARGIYITQNSNQALI